jgi:DNA-directed RNA polymerase I, II, and III subunit RPABC2
MSSGIPAPPKKTQFRDPDAEDNEEEIMSELGDDASSIASDADTSSSVADTTDDSDTDTEADAAAADSSADEAELDDAAAADAGGGGGGDSDDEAISKKTKKKRAAASSASKKNMEDDLTLLGVPHGIHFDDDEDDDADGDDEDEDADKDSSEYFQKLKSNVRESYIDTYHPESLSHNYDEIQTLSRVVRNSAGVIVDELHRTIPIMTKYEKTRILGQRTKQINEGAPTFIKIDSTVIDGYLIAMKELEQKKTPFIIRRPLPNGGSEYWRIQDLEII